MPAHVRRFWTSIDRLLGGARDHAAYGEGIRRGYVMVAARVPEADAGHVAAVLERHGAADLDACHSAWLAGGPGGAGTQDHADDGAMRSDGDVVRRAEIDRAVACVLAAASAEGAYRFRAVQGAAAAAPRGSTEGSGDRPSAGMGEARRVPASPDGAGGAGPPADVARETGLGHEDEQPVQDGARLPAQPAPGQRAKGLAVVCSDGHHLGTIEEVEGATMKVRSGDPPSNGVVRSIPTAWIHSIHDRVTLKFTDAEIRRRSVIA